ncbi:hypothetical protein CITRIK5_100071 [Citricoccus sp. K5]|nr:hypothetical protein CITRIK5_100005 [Citricoccus sp. K5]VXA94011.1 hypothetical protein CITRIK5_100071 [Citricoccus sp. K5]
MPGIGERNDRDPCGPCLLNYRNVHPGEDAARQNSTLAGPVKKKHFILLIVTICGIIREITGVS